jgi:hypothetical protein
MKIAHVIAGLLLTSSLATPATAQGANQQEQLTGASIRNRRP